MLPLLSPVRTSPFWLKATQVTYLGLSLLSKMPIRLYNIPPLSKDQKDTCPLPQDTIWFRSSGCHSAQTTVSTEHCNRQSSAVKWPVSGPRPRVRYYDNRNIRKSRLFFRAIVRYTTCRDFLIATIVTDAQRLPSSQWLWCRGRSSASPKSICCDRRSRRWRTGNSHRRPWRTTGSRWTRRIHRCRSRSGLLDSRSSIFWCAAEIQDCQCPAVICQL